MITVKYEFWSPTYIRRNPANVMKIGFLSKSRGLRNLGSRIFTVTRHFGMSPNRFNRRLEQYYKLVREAGCLPTFAITAVVLARHPEYIRKLSAGGVEFTIHGYMHIDYKVVDNRKMNEHFSEAIRVFNDCHIPFVGFRAPFLRINNNTSPILSELNFLYNSSQALWWPVDTGQYSEHIRDNLDLLLQFYTPLNADEYLSLPRFNDNLIELPVSIPDDEALIERLGITDPKKISDIWLDILEKTYHRGEMFNLSLHPERVEYCETSLLEVIKKARQYDAPVWIATLREVTEWWREKEKFAIDVKSVGEGSYRIKAICSERATLISKNCKISVPVKSWFDGYQQVLSTEFTLESSVAPIIGLSSNSNPAVIKYLESEGYIVDIHRKYPNYAIYLGEIKKFSHTDEKPLSEKIERAEVPLLRYWRWPDGARSVLSITGDIDSITLWDFALRIWESKFS